MIYRFAEFDLDTTAGELRRQGKAQELEPQVFDLVAYLVANPGRLVTREELFEAIWHGRIVSEATLSSRIKAARKALGDDGTQQRLIRTVHGRGFRFLGKVEFPQEEAAPAAVPQVDDVSVPTPPVDRPSLAVLPFGFRGEDPAQAYLAEGLAEEVTSALSRVRSFLVISRASAFRYRDSEADVREIAAALGVRYLLQGAVRQKGDSLRVSVQLIDAPTREEVWAGRFRAELSDVFDLEEEITEQIVGVLEPTILTAEVRRLRRRRPDDMSAYELMLKALPDVWTLSPEANARATGLLERAVAADPDYPLAQALLSWCHGQYLVYNWPGDREFHRQEALRLARSAARLDPDDPLVLILLATAESTAGDVAAAEVHVARGLALDQNSAWGWNRSGFIHCYLGHPEVARMHFQRALRLSPFDPMRALVYVGLGLAGFVAEDYEEAVGWIERALLENPEIVWVHRLLAACAAMAGDMDKARRSVSIVEGYVPDIRAGDIVAAIPHQQAAVRERYLQALLKAGFRR